MSDIQQEIRAGLEFVMMEETEEGRTRMIPSTDIQKEIREALEAVEKLHECAKATCEDDIDEGLVDNWRAIAVSVLTLAGEKISNLSIQVEAGMERNRFQEAQIRALAIGTVTCEDCGFRYGAEHMDSSGLGYSCPNCAEATLAAERDRAETLLADRDNYRESMGRLASLAKGLATERDRWKQKAEAFEKGLEREVKRTMSEETKVVWEENERLRARVEELEGMGEDVDFSYLTLIRRLAGIPEPGTSLGRRIQELAAVEARVKKLEGALKAAQAMLRLWEQCFPQGCTPDDVDLHIQIDRALAASEEEER